MSQLGEQLEVLPGLLTAHVQLTLFALLIATLVSVPLGVVATRVRWLEQVSMGVASVIQTIPGLALLAVMVPVLAWLGASGIGTTPALIGLTLYCIFPILMGTVTGIREVDPAMLEAARGVGMTPTERLRLVELPLAMPVIVSGLRTATVWCVGMATLSTPVGAPSLGNYIFGGLQTRNYVAVLVGCAAAAVLAQVLDRVVKLLEQGVRERRRALVMAPATVLVALFVFATGAGAREAFSGEAETQIRVGAKTFTEQYVLSELVAGEIRARAHRPTELVQSLGSSVAFDALRAGDIDLYVDYSGTIWATVMKRTEVPADRRALLSEVRRYLADEHGIVLVASLGFENTYALAMRQSDARAAGISRISELGPKASGMVIGGDFEFFQRAEWKSLVDAYGLEFREERTMDPSLMYEAVRSGSVDVISGYSTDGRIAAFELTVLEDDRRAIPPYDAILLASAKLAREAPEVLAALRELDGAIDADTMRRMNQAVDLGGATPADAVAQWREGRGAGRAAPGSSR